MKKNVAGERLVRIDAKIAHLFHGGPRSGLHLTICLLCDKMRERGFP